MMTNTHKAESLTVFNAPFDGDMIQMRNGEQWQLKQQMNPLGWTLFDAQKQPHSIIQRIPGMVELIRAIDEYNENP
jgi:hypothetical protein